MIEKLTPSSPVLAWLLDYINERIADDKRWNVSNEVKSFGRNIFDESYIERGEGLRFKLRSPETIKLYRDVLREMETDALEQMKGFYDQFEGELEGHALTPEDLKGGVRGIGSYFRKLRDGRLSDKDVLNATLQNSLADAKNWATKTSSRKDDIICLAKTSLMPLLHGSRKNASARNRTLNSCRLSLQHLNKLQLLNHIDEEVRTLNREHNRFLLSDTNALLHKLVREGDSSFVFEKIGANIRNVMIDEFQDTSRMQWDNFRLLLLEGLSQGADSLIVGDVKQSIYRWRNGDWGILNSLGSDQSKVPLCDAKVPLYDAEVPLYDAKPLHCESGVQLPFPFPVRVETLKTNRRSETNVIHFNNRLFTAAVDYLNALHLEELKEECIPLKRAYADVAQESPEDGKPKAMSKSPSWSPMKNRTTRKRPCRLWAKKCKAAFGRREAERYNHSCAQKQEYTAHCGLLRQRAAPARCIGRSVPLGCLACHLHADRCPALPVQSGREDSESLVNRELQFADYR